MAAFGSMQQCPRRLIRQCAQLPVDTPSDIAGAAVYTLQLLARRVLELTTQINDLNQRITEVLTAHTPQLLDHYGVGPDTAAVLLVTAGDNPQRLHSEASFAALCGVSPVEASSGKAQRVDSIEVETDKQTAPCTPSSCPGCAGTPAAATTSNAASPKAGLPVKRSAA